jgi:hypothetical protein
VKDLVNQSQTSAKQLNVTCINKKARAMKFDPLTRDVYTDKDEFVKTMN